MLQRSSLPTALPTEIADSLQRTFNPRWLDALQTVLWLPETYRHYLIVLVVSLAVGAGMFTHVWLSVQIAEQRYTLRTLAAQRQHIERETSEIIHAIATTTSLRQIEHSALVQGYRPATARKYLRRDELARDGALVAGMLAAPPPATASRPLPGAPPAPPSAAHAGGWIDAVARGVGAAGQSLQQQASHATGALRDLTAHFQAQLTEHWMR